MSRLSATARSQPVSLDLEGVGNRVAGVARRVSAEAGRAHFHGSLTAWPAVDGVYVPRIESLEKISVK